MIRGPGGLIYIGSEPPYGELGGALGVWAASNDRVSHILRPINDALQTMPQFVFLIPALMFFKVGEFTALIAIMLYAIVPPIRYVEHGLRNVRPDVVEAARQMGATPAQLLWQVRLPLARPVVMLGLNQTIMAAISMLVIAAMVGTRDLGQLVIKVLGKTSSWSPRRRKEWHRSSRGVLSCSFR